LSYRPDHAGEAHELASVLPWDHVGEEGDVQGGQCAVRQAHKHHYGHCLVYVLYEHAQHRCKGK
jgi:hypothetical protein